MQEPEPPSYLKPTWAKEESPTFEKGVLQGIGQEEGRFASEAGVKETYP
jgi:hypothetical protein